MARKIIANSALVAASMLSAFGLPGASSAEPAPAAASDQREPVRVELRAREGCPGADKFLLEVLLRTRHQRPAERSEFARVLRVDLKARGKSTLGELRLAGSLRDTLHVSISGNDCQRVSSMLAVIASLALEPEGLDVLDAPDLQEPGDAGAPPPAPSPILETEADAGAPRLKNPYGGKQRLTPLPPLKHNPYPRH